MSTSEWNLGGDAPTAGAGEGGTGTGDKGKNKAGGECSGGSAEGGAGAVDPRERHKLAERERRKSMRELFLSLHSLLPHAGTVRKEQSVILDEIIKYIPLAAARLRALESRRQQMITSSSGAATARSTDVVRSNVDLTASSPSSSYCDEDGGNGNAAGACRRSTTTTTTTRKRSRSTRDADGAGDGDRTGRDCSNGAMDCEIRLAPEPTSSTTVAIRVRGDRVNVSLTDGRGGASSSAQTNILLSAVLDELEAHQLDLVRSIHCRDGSKLLHHSESKIREGADRSTPGLLKASLQELAGKLHGMRKPVPAATAVKRAPDHQHSAVEEDST